jgi:hypothetical protein
MKDDKIISRIKCPLCNLPFEDGDTGGFLGGRVYHIDCLRLNERLTNSKGQLGEKSLMNRFKAAQRKTSETQVTPPVSETQAASENKMG